MKALLSTLQSDATIAEAFFTLEEQAERLPFVRFFPKGSCEVVSVIFSIAVATKYPQSRVEVARAYSPPRNEWHFWAEVDGVVVDITAHQFPEHQCPLICTRPSPLELEFSDVERLTPQTALERLDFISPEIRKSVVTALEQEIVV
ncbi:MAG: hypothetical protein V4713_02820 [Pseudomonadota bacterium]